MKLITRYLITDQIPVEGMSGLPVLSEIPYFMKLHRKRLKCIDDIVIVVSNRNHLRPNSIRLHTFHTHRTPFAAIDALSLPLAEFFIKSGVFPEICPIFFRYKDLLEKLSPDLYKEFAARGILIPKDDDK